MEAISIPPSGAYFAARFFSVLPLVVFLVAWIARRMQGEIGLWGASRFGYLLLVLVLVAYYGVIWNWLFRGQFYDVTSISDSRWDVGYRMPPRIESLDPRDIARISGENLGSITGGATTGRIVIELADGTRVRSAQVARHRIAGYIDALQALLPDAAQVQ